MSQVSAAEAAHPPVEAVTVFWKLVGEVSSTTPSTSTLTIHREDPTSIPCTKTDFYLYVRKAFGDDKLLAHSDGGSTLTLEVDADLASVQAFLQCGKDVVYNAIDVAALRAEFLAPPSLPPILPSPPPPPPASPPPMICLDTCGTAGDGVCQDGDWGAMGDWCEFGTDCSDCGPRLLLDPPHSPPPSAEVTVNTIPDHCTVQDCERNLAEGQAKYQQAVAAGQQAKDGWDGLCRLSGQLHAGATPSDSSLLTADSFTDCNCGIDTASFGTVADCSEFLASMERACETLRACADSDSGARDAGLAIGLALGGCLLVAVLLAAGYVWHRRRLMQKTLDAKAKAPPKANARRTVARTWRTAHLNAAARGRGSDAAHSTCAVQPAPGLDTARE
jgi:hypothetical protein